jgi:hypothetical protein
MKAWCKLPSFGTRAFALQGEGLLPGDEDRELGNVWFHGIDPLAFPQGYLPAARLDCYVT